MPTVSQCTLMPILVAGLGLHSSLAVASASAGADRGPHVPSFPMTVTSTVVSTVWTHTSASVRSVTTFMSAVQPLSAVPAAPAGIRRAAVGPGGQEEGAHAVGERG
jgi:hypothetical protein